MDNHFAYEVLNNTQSSGQMAEKRQIILDIQARTGDIAKRIDQINLELVQNAVELKKVNDNYKQGFLTQQQYAKQAARLKEDTRGLRGELRELTKTQELDTKATNAKRGSNEQLRAQLSLLTKQYNRLSKEERENTAAGQQLQKNIKGISDELKKNEKAVGDNRRNVGNYQEAIEGAIGSLGGFGGSIANVALQITKGGGMIAVLGLASQAFSALVAGVKEAISTFVQFDEALAILEAISGSTAEEMQMLEEDARRLGETTQFTASQVVELQTNFARVGFDSSQIIAATEATLNLAVATGEDLASASEVAAATLGGYQLTAEETTRVTDVMAASFNASALNLEKFRESTKLVAPVAANLNVDIETVTGALGNLADAGLSGSIAGTGLRNILLELGDESSNLSQRVGFAVDSSEDFIKAFEILSTQGITTSEALQLVDRRALPAFLTLVNGADDVARLADEFKNAGGAAAEAAAIVADTAAGDIKTFNSAVEGVAISLGDRLEPVIRSVVQGATSLVRYLSTEFFGVFDTLKEVFKPLVAAFQDLFSEIGKIIQGFTGAANQTSYFQGIIKILSNVIKVFITPLRLLISGISEFVGFVREAYQESTIFRGVIDALISPFRSVYTLVTNTSAAVAGFKAAFTEGITGIQNAAEILVVNLELLARKVQNFFNSSDEVTAKIQELESRKEELSSVGTDLGDAFTEAYNAAVQGKIDPIAPEVDTNIVEDNVEEVTKLAGKSLKELKDELSNLQEAFDTATTSATRAAIAAQIKELQAQIDSAQQVLKTATAEKKAAAPDTSSLTFDVEEPDPDNDPVIKAEEARIAKQRELDQQAKEDALRRDAKFYERLSAFRKQQADEQLKAEEEQARKQIEIENLKRDAQLATVDAIAQAASFGIELLGEQTVAGKALGVIQATASTYVAANQALASAPPPANFILTGLTIAQGLANVAKIVRAADGGYISGPGTGTSDSIPAMLSNGESVITARATSQYWPVLDAINQSAGGNPIRPRFAKGGIATFANGGLATAVSASIDNGAFAQQQAATQNANAQSALLNDTIQNMPAPIVTVKDISNASNRVRVKQNTRSL